MDERVIWSPTARKRLIEILEYWKDRNRSNSYSIKLKDLFEKAAQLIADHPKMGKQTDDKKIRFKIVRDYLMFYEESADKIHILTIWDTRQDPEKLTIK